MTGRKKRQLLQGWATHFLIRQATMAYLMKGGFIRILEPEPILAKLMQKLKTQPDWKALRKESKPLGRKPYLRLILQCVNPTCKKKPATFKGKDETHALLNAWKVGWDSYEEDGIRFSFCPKCKPGVSNGKYVPGRKLHDRLCGELFTINEYKGKGEHTLNFGHWPELWCTDNIGSEKVFIFWGGRLPDNIHLVSQ